MSRRISFNYRLFYCWHLEYCDGNGTEWTEWTEWLRMNRMTLGTASIWWCNSLTTCFQVQITMWMEPVSQTKWMLLTEANHKIAISALRLHQRISLMERLAQELTGIVYWMCKMIKYLILDCCWFTHNFIN